MQSYKIVLEEGGPKRELELTPEGKEDKKGQNGTYAITEKGKDLGRLEFKNGKYHYKGDAAFSPDEINLLALSLTSNQQELVIDSEEDDLDDDEDL